MNYLAIAWYRINTLVVYGFDGGKKVKGRKRHIIVDSQGLLIGVLVTEANGSERLGAIVVFYESKEKLTQLEVVWVDQGSPVKVM